MEWGDATLPFGWKESAFFYHSTGFPASSFIRVLGIPGSLYIDERLNGELVSRNGCWSVSHLKEIATLALELLKLRYTLFAIFLVDLGYFFGFSQARPSASYPHYLSGSHC